MDVIQTNDCAVSTDEICGIKDKSGSKKLKKRLIKLNEENNRLVELVNEKNYEISELHQSIKGLNDVLNSMPINELRSSNSVASTKILELSKNNRILKSDLEATKNRLNKKEIEIRKLQTEMKSIEGKTKELQKKESTASIEEYQGKIKALQQKLFETRNKNVEFSNQLKLAQKCLQQEIGEHFSFNELILNASSSSNNWRGRAQQILSLQNKIQELKNRLQNYEQQNMETVYRSKHGIMATTNTAQLNAIFERPEIRKTELQHRVKVDCLQKEICSMKTELQQQREKILALKVRNKNLNEEVFRYKLQMHSLEQETQYKNLNVATINDKLNEQQLHYEKIIENLRREMEENSKTIEETEIMQNQMQSKINELEICLMEKNENIKELNDIIKKLEDDMRAICGGFLYSCRELRKEEFMAILDSLEAEKNALIQQNKLLNERINEERIKNTNVQEQAVKQKIRIARLEAKIKELEKDLNLQAEKKKRSMRIAEYAQSVCNSLSSSASVSSFTFENSNYTPSESATADDMNDIVNVDDLKNRLELCTEKNTILEEKLSHTLAEKEKDLKTFEDILKNSKTLILNTILDHRNGCENSSLDMTV